MRGTATPFDPAARFAAKEADEGARHRHSRGVLWKDIRKYPARRAAAPG